MLKSDCSLGNLSCADIPVDRCPVEICTIYNGLCADRLSCVVVFSSVLAVFDVDVAFAVNVALLGINSDVVVVDVAILFLLFNGAFTRNTLLSFNPFTSS
jgi:hypothetical protein